MFDDTRNKLANYANIYQRSWWGSLAVHVGLLAAAYGAIWTAIEPLSVPDEIPMGEYFIDRRFAHIMLSIIVAAYGSLLISAFARWLADHNGGRAQQQVRDGSLLSVDELKKLAEINQIHLELNRQASEQLRSRNAEVNARLGSTIAEKSRMEQKIAELEAAIEQGSSITTEQSQRLANAIKERDRLNEEVVSLKRELEESQSTNSTFAVT